MTEHPTSMYSDEEGGAYCCPLTFQKFRFTGDWKSDAGKAAREEQLFHTRGVLARALRYLGNRAGALDDDPYSLHSFNLPFDERKELAEHYLLERQKAIAEHFDNKY